jgi:two-component system, sensor histidine kinase YesM
MKHIQSKLLLSFIAISIIPVIAVGLFSYAASSDAVFRKMETGVMSNLQLVERSVDERVNRVDKYMDLIFRNSTVHAALKDPDFDTNTIKGRQIELDLESVLSSYFYKESGVMAALLVTSSGQYFSFNGYTSSVEGVLHADWYRSVLNASGRITWGGIITNPLENTGILERNGKCCVVGRVIKDATGQSTDFFIPLGALFVFLDLNDFSSASLNASAEDDNLSMLILDATGVAVSSPERSEVGQAAEYGFWKELAGRESGYTRTTVGGKDTMIYFRTTQLGWKIVELVPLDYFTSETGRIIGMTALVSAVCLLVVSLLAFIISSTISRPLSALASQMDRLGGEDFAAAMPIDSKDEIGRISQGFNDMVGRIKALFQSLSEKEAQKRSEEILKLQYQVNPHFLYNTLGSIRFVAMAQKADNVADMLLALSRLLRNTLQKADMLICVCEELENVRDYLFLQQIRYNNRLVVEYEVDADTLEFRIPGILLQPLVENAIVHGLNDRLNSGQLALLRIGCRRAGGTLEFWVHDNGRGIDPSVFEVILNTPHREKGGGNGAHIGVKNIHDRIRLQFGEGYGVFLESRPCEYTRMMIRLPQCGPEATRND